MADIQNLRERLKQLLEEASSSSPKLIMAASASKEEKEEKAREIPNERIHIQVSHELPESSSSEERIVNLDVTVRGRRSSQVAGYTDSIARFFELPQRKKERKTSLRKKLKKMETASQAQHTDVEEMEKKMWNKPETLNDGEWKWQTEAANAVDKWKQRTEKLQPRSANRTPKL